MTSGENRAPVNSLPISDYMKEFLEKLYIWSMEGKSSWNKDR